MRRWWLLVRMAPVVGSCNVVFLIVYGGISDGYLLPSWSGYLVLVLIPRRCSTLCFNLLASQDR